MTTDTWKSEWPVHTAAPRLDVTAPEMAGPPTPCHGAYPRNYPIKSPRSSNSLLSPSRASSTASARPMMFRLRLEPGTLFPSVKRERGSTGTRCIYEWRCPSPLVRILRGRIIRMIISVCVCVCVCVCVLGVQSSAFKVQNLFIKVQEGFWSIK